MDIEKADVEWLIMLIVAIWPYVRKYFKGRKPKKKSPVKRGRGKRRR